MPGKLSNRRSTAFLLRQTAALLFLTTSWRVCAAVKDKASLPRNPGRIARSLHQDPPFTVANLTCDHFQQPLNHFDLPRNQSGFYQQRFCYYNGFVPEGGLATAPVFFYTGNESPIEEYVNHTGLIWEMAPQFGAQVVFVEHRYEGKSLPSAELPHCLAYASSYQALADFARFIEVHLFDNITHRRRPVIVFGGSYGGMLAAWMRMLSPHLVAGAIAGSAPIGGFPTNRPRSIDAAFSVIAHGLAQNYPPTLPQKEPLENHCPNNLLAAWPLIQVLSREGTGRRLLQESFSLCQLPPADAQVLTAWAQSPWFDMAEGSFPYPSSYITYALTKKLVNLPAWPLQAACWNASALHKDWNVRFDGDLSKVRYNITYGQSDLSIAVDWDQATAHMPCVEGDKDCWRLALDGDSIRGLLESVRDAVSLWFNVTHDVKCYNLTAAPSQTLTATSSVSSTPRNLRIQNDEPPATQCKDRMEQGSWPLLCCNEEMNLIITEASGLGKDVFWPPSHPRGTETYADTLDPNATGVYDFCQDPDGNFGFPQSTADPWATWMDIRYGGLHVSSHSNIIFSNGLLDPWSAAGVYAKGGDPSRRSSDGTKALWQPYKGIDGLYLQNITGDSDRMIAVIMEVGGHHTDLFYSDVADPPSVRGARAVQREYMERWIREFWTENEVPIEA